MKFWNDIVKVEDKSKLRLKATGKKQILYRKKKIQALLLPIKILSESFPWKESVCQSKREELRAADLSQGNKSRAAE